MQDTHSVDARPTPATTNPDRLRRELPRVVAWAAVLLALLVRVVPAIDAIRPIVFEDEMGYLANARALAGAGLTRLGEMGFYEPGWSLVLAPVYWVTHDPTLVCRLAISLSVLAGWAALWPLAAVARRLGVKTRTTAVTLGAVATMVPGSVLMSGYVYAESFTLLVFATLTLLAMLTWEGDRRWAAIAFGALASFSPFVHGRAIAIPVLAAAWLVATWRWRRVNGRTLLVALGAAVLIQLIGRHVDDWLKTAVYDLAFDRMSRGLDEIRAISPRTLLIETSGQLWYLGATTAGLTFLGVWRWSVGAWTELRERLVGPQGFALLAFGSVLAISIVNFMGTVANPSRLDYYAYGRYIDAIAPMLVVAGLAWLLRARPRERVLGLAATFLLVGGAATVFWLAVGHGEALIGKPIAALSVPGIAWAIDPQVARLPAFLVTVASLAVICVLAGIARWRSAVVAVWVCAAVASVVVGETRTMTVLDRPWSTLLTLQPVLRSLDPAEITYETAGASLYGRNGYQFYLPDTTFVFVDDESRPQTDLVIARRDSPLADRFGARLVAADIRVDQALWAMPGSVQEELAARGWLSADGEPLPSAAKQYSARLSGLPDRGATVELKQNRYFDVVFTHMGSGAPWDALGTRGKDATGTVRAQAIWTCSGKTYVRIADLSQSVMPGESVEVKFPAQSDWVGPGASCHVSIGLIEEGVGPLDATPPIELTVQR